MQHLFWLEEGRIAGRSGPNKDQWNLSELKDAGISAILSVNDGEACDEQACEQLGIDYLCTALPASIPPQEGDLAICTEQLPKALAFIEQQEQKPGAVLIHCRSGKDRTALTMAYYLMMKGTAPLHAVSQVRSIRDIAFSSEGWDQFAFDVLYQLQD